MTRTTTSNAFEGRTAWADLVVTLEALKASPPSPKLKGKDDGSRLGRPCRPTCTQSSSSPRASTIGERPSQGSACASSTCHFSHWYLTLARAAAGEKTTDVQFSWELREQIAQYKKPSMEL
jgi:hypothetical protein